MNGCRITARSLNRRRFVQGAGVAGLGLLAGCRQLPYQNPARQGASAPRVGFLSPSPAESAHSYVAAFQQGLRELGWVEGRNVEIAYRFAEGHDDRVRDLATELVGLGVRVIVTEGGPATDTARQVAGSIPIVFGAAADPVATGLVASIPRPGGNVTGLTSFSPELAGKRLELLTQLVPTMTRVAVLWNAGNTGKVREFEETVAAAHVLGLQALPLLIRAPADVEGAFELASQQGAEALATLGDPLMVNHRARIIELAAVARLPAIYALRLFVDAGGLMNYGPNIADMFRRAGYYVDRILKGTEPADLPVEQPREFDLVINLKTAQALGLNIPQHVLLQATELIQ